MTLLWYALLISLTVILIRLTWVFAVAALVRLYEKMLHLSDRYGGWRNTLVIGWTGMRGGVSLATALALPLLVSKNVAFPNRDVLLFLTFGVILFTLVVQGLTLGPLIKWLGLQWSPSPDLEDEIRQAKLATSHVALARLDELAQEPNIPDEFVSHMRSYFEKKVSVITAHASGQIDVAKKRENQEHHASKQRFLKSVIQAERNALVTLRYQDTIDDDVMRTLERELDLEELQLGNEQLPTTVSEKA